MTASLDLDPKSESLVSSSIFRWGRSARMWIARSRNLDWAFPSVAVTIGEDLKEGSSLEMIGVDYLDRFYIIWWMMIRAYVCTSSESPWNIAYSKDSILQSIRSPSTAYHLCGTKWAHLWGGFEPMFSWLLGLRTDAAEESADFFASFFLFLESIITVWLSSFFAWSSITFSRVDA